jgi:hypothetical protein
MAIHSIYKLLGEVKYMKDYSITIGESNLDEIYNVIDSHIESLAYPMDSFLEDKLLSCDKYKILFNNKLIGYAGVYAEELYFFHVLHKYFDFAPDILELFISEKNINRIFIMSQDPLFVALISEWDYKKEKDACFFIDGKRKERQIIKNDTVFRLANLEDIKVIVDETGTFFDKLEKRVEEGTIFMLERENELLGCGVIEKGIFFKDCVSIGMITCSKHRKKGVGQEILWNLKEWAYSNSYKPVAGCWYYNILSRKTLEKVGMTMTSVGFEAILIGKEKPPMRTGNPPGELV